MENLKSDQFYNPHHTFKSLEQDEPLFGMSKGGHVIIDSSLKPKAGDLVLLKIGELTNIYRYEVISEKINLWPGNICVSEKELEANVIIHLVRDFP